MGGSETSFVSREMGDQTRGSWRVGTSHEGSRNPTQRRDEVFQRFVSSSDPYPGVQWRLPGRDGPDGSLYRRHGPRALEGGSDSPSTESARERVPRTVVAPDHYVTPPIRTGHSVATPNSSLTRTVGVGCRGGPVVGKEVGGVGRLEDDEVP